MNDRVVPGPVQDSCGIREAVCIHTKKIYDSCRDKDCIEDLRVYPTRASQAVIDRALSVRGGRAELLQAYIDVEPASYNRGFYSVDIRYYYRITAEAFVGGSRPAEISGLAVFDKRVLLFGSEGNAKIFTSRFRPEAGDCQGMGRSNLPEAVVEAVDPIVLDTKATDCPPTPSCDCGRLMEIPSFIAQSFSGQLVFDDSASRRFYVTLGQFTLVRLERDTQLLIPVYDYCVPQSECPCDAQEDPCGLFRSVAFPVNEFFPPNTVDAPNDYNSTRSYCACH